MQTRVIFFTGKSGSGKSTLAQFARESLGDDTIVQNVGDLLEMELRNNFDLGPIRRANVGKQFLAKYDRSEIQAVISKFIIYHGPKHIVIIDGIRYLETLIFLKEKFPFNFHAHIELGRIRRINRVFRRNMIDSERDVFRSGYDEEVNELKLQANIILSNDYVEQNADQLYKELSSVKFCKI